LERDFQYTDSHNGHTNESASNLKGTVRRSFTQFGHLGNEPIKLLKTTYQSVFSDQSQTVNLYPLTRNVWLWQ